jgi:hypothetical protein
MRSRQLRKIDRERSGAVGGNFVSTLARLVREEAAQGTFHVDGLGLGKAAFAVENLQEYAVDGFDSSRRSCQTRRNARRGPSAIDLEVAI